MSIKFKIEEVVYDTKWALQRAKRGYGDIDTWNFDEYVARLIKENCFRLASDGNGYPDELSGKECKGMTAEKWKQILLDISFGFGSYLEMRSGIYISNEKEFKRLKKEYENGMKIFLKYHEYLWD